MIEQKRTKLGTSACWLKPHAPRATASNKDAVHWIQVDRKGYRLNESLKRLYDQHAPALRLYARTWCRHPDDAIQEAMIELAKQSQVPAAPSN